MNLGLIAEVIMLIGMVLIVIAGFLVHTALGFLLSGIFIIVLGGLLYAVHVSDEIKGEGGG